MASLTRNFIASATNPLPDKTNETVDLETPARRATSMMVTRPTRSAASPLSSSDIRLPNFLERSNYWKQRTIGTSPHKDGEICIRGRCDLERDNLSLSQPIGVVNTDRSEDMSVAASLRRSVLDALTDVDLPKRHPARTARGSVEADSIRLPVYACDALVLGSGAAGWRAAVELKRRGIDVMVATQYLY